MTVGRAGSWLDWWKYLVAASTPRATTLQWLFATLGVALLILANKSLNDERITVAVAISIVIGLMLWTIFAGALDTWSPRIVKSAQRNHTLTHVQWGLLAISIACGIGAFYWSGGNQFRTSGVVCWIVAVGSWIAAWWPAPLMRTRLPSLLRTNLASTNTSGTSLSSVFPFVSSRPTRRSLALSLALMIIMTAGVVTFFFQVDETPRDPTSDHAEKLFDVQTIIDGQRPIFFENNTGREPMQFYVIYSMVEWLGSPLNFTTMKVGTAAVGLLALPFVYLLAAELGGVAAGLAASALFAIGKWPIEISRAGLRFPYGMTFAAITLWLLVRWMRTGDRRDALGCGLALGAGLYGYSPFRAVVPVVALGFLILFLAPRGPVTQAVALRHGLLAATTAFVVFVPLCRYAIDKPENFWLRSTTRIAGEDESSSLRRALTQLSTFLENNWNAALSFKVRGDTTIVNAVTLDPFLDVITGAFLLAGVATVIQRIIRRRDPVLIVALLAIPILFLPSTLALGFPGENPSVNRAAGAIPLIFTFAALPVAVLAQSVPRTYRPRIMAAIGATLLAVVMTTATRENMLRFYRDFDEQSREIVVNTTEIATALRGAAAFGVEPENAYLVDRAHWLDVRNIAIAIGDLSWSGTNNIPMDAPLPVQQPGEPLLFILKSDDWEGIERVRQAFPDGQMSTVHTEIPWQAFEFYLVPATTMPEDPLGADAIIEGELVLDELDP